MLSVVEQVYNVVLEEKLKEVTTNPSPFSFHPPKPDDVCCYNMLYKWTPELIIWLSVSFCEPIAQLHQQIMKSPTRSYWQTMVAQLECYAFLGRFDVDGIKLKIQIKNYLTNKRLIMHRLQMYQTAVNANQVRMMCITLLYKHCIL
ncbi:unnamed protein product [Lactuca saligna]|uniref:Uncharacterized protein n=1 Tax=Lactuca saligna TaxID=75948 RepID=A0AA36E1F5_LACSI|nr:unnamed protein product [Lactuca saligna]